jgi:Heterokaryon incompatibility protein (HET)
MPPLYTPFNQSKDEIRVLTILPKSQRTRNEVVQCRLEIRSLTSFNLDYEAFTLSSSSSRSNKLKSMLDWIQSRQHSEELTPSLSPTAIRECPGIYQRFTWGDYAALSYVWGDESKTRRIIVNGHEMNVTLNLERALRAFRDASEFHSSFGLWADAICINQKDLEERGRQVRKMREIYGKAWTVIAWLGEEAYQSDKAFQLLQKLSHFYKTQRNSVDLASQLSQDPGYLGDGCWYALMQLMERPYWYRLWIIQEMVMGASAMMLRCGTSSIEWNSLCLGIEILQEELWLVKDDLLRRDIASLGGPSGKCLDGLISPAPSPLGS